MGSFSKNIHPFYGELLLYLAQDCGLDAEQLKPASDAFKGLQENPDDQWYVELIYKMMATSKYRGKSIGFEYGQRLDLAAAGIIGQAVMTAPTLGDSLQLMCRYYVLTGLELHFTIEQHDDEIILFPVLNYDDLDTRFEIFIFEAFISSWRKCASLLVNYPPTVKRVELNYPPPSYAYQYKQLTMGEVLFNSPKTAAVLDTSIMSLPTISGNSFVHERSVAHCEAALSKLGENQSTHIRVQKQLRMQVDLSRVTVDSIAEAMHISSRTLIRRLQSEGYRFQDLLDLYRYNTACRLLTDHGWNLEKIAGYLGYSDASNFRRAFKKWSGLTPREYRDQH